MAFNIKIHTIMLKTLRRKLEEAPTSKRLDILNINTNNICNGLMHNKCIYISEFVMMQKSKQLIGHHWKMLVNQTLFQKIVNK